MNEKKMIFVKRHLAETYSKRVRRPVLFAGAGLVVLLLPACMQPSPLSPAPEAQTVTGETKAAQATAMNVSVVAQTEWKGEPDVVDNVTPVRIAVDNNGARPVKLAYRNFSLVSPEGGQFASLPPYEVTGTIQDPQVAYGSTVGAGFHHSGFHLAGHYGPIYPGLSLYGSRFFHDPHYHDTYYSYWEQQPLPTEYMLEQALPEGALDPGGSLEGYLYFQKVPQRMGSVTLRYDLVDPDTNERFGEIRIPFTVESNGGGYY